MYTEQLTQEIGFCTEVDPQVVNNQTKTTGGIDLQQFKRAFFVLNIGAVTGGGTIAAKLQEANNANLSDASDLAGTNVSITGKTTANKLETFEVRADQVTKRYVRLSVTEGGSQNVNVSVVGFGMDAIHKPGNAQNAASVDTQSVVS